MSTINYKYDDAGQLYFKRDIENDKSRYAAYYYFYPNGRVQCIESYIYGIGGQKQETYFKSDGRLETIILPHEENITPHMIMSYYYDEKKNIKTIEKFSPYTGSPQRFRFEYIYY